MKRSEDGHPEPESVRGSGHFEKSMETLGGPDPVQSIQPQHEKTSEETKEAWGDFDE